VRAHLLNAFLALVFSVLIWSAVGAQLSAEAKLKVDFVISVPPDVTVTYLGRHALGELRIPMEVDVRGPRELLDRLAPNDVAARRTLTHEQTFLREALTSGATLTLEVSANEDVRATRPGIEVVATNPSQLPIAFSQVVEWEPRVQRPQIVGTPAPGFKVSNVVLDRTRVPVRGPSTVRERNPGPYEVEPIDVTGERSELRLTRSVDTPAGVTCDARVLVVVSIVPEPETRELLFPIRVVVSSPRTSSTIDPLKVAVLPRPPIQDWSYKLPLRGAAADLDMLEQALDRERRSPGTGGPDLPVAYIRVDEFPAGPDLHAAPDIVVVGLPPGITLAQKVEFPIVTAVPADREPGDR
jgi:hypothetical protein